MLSLQIKIPSLCTLLVPALFSSPCPCAADPSFSNDSFSNDSFLPTGFALSVSITVLQCTARPLMRLLTLSLKSPQQNLLRSFTAGKHNANPKERWQLLDHPGFGCMILLLVFQSNTSTPCLLQVSHGQDIHSYILGLPQSNSRYQTFSRKRLLLPPLHLITTPEGSHCLVFQLFSV